MNSVSGCTDYFAKDESEALELGRDIISTLNITMNDRLSSTSEDPLYDPHELRGMISKDNQMDIYKVWYLYLNEVVTRAIPEKDIWRF